MDTQTIAERVEQIRCKGDGLLEKLLPVAWVISLTLGFVYDTLMTGILLSSGWTLLFLISKYLLAAGLSAGMYW